MRVELLHYKELGMGGELDRTGISIVKNNKTMEFKAKGDTSEGLRTCGTNRHCLLIELKNFNDFEVKEDAEIVVNGKKLTNEM